ncbi:MAG: UDP-glucose 4-epimerase [Halobacteriovorax sp.]|nr:UDP-glucose 4-epimerase [Halobacteriovorax sp.]|tara:strand:+ start:78065 stop:79036 length:972 start_codon:yes stop_codon:yes gene_type:complete
MSQVLITGGAGYVGSELVPLLLENNYSVVVLDLFLYGETLSPHKNLKLIKGDLRNSSVVKEALKGCESVIHLACISNDPSFDLDPKLGKSINLDSFRPLVEASINAGVKRFINASSSSVYGVKDESSVHEGLNLEPLTDYSIFKAECERILESFQSENFTTVSIRPATVCGVSRRQRLDVIVNILVNNAHNKNKILVFGGEQKRPNIHIKDMCQAYMLLLNAPSKKIAGKVFNVGDENFPVKDLAQLVKKHYPSAQVETIPSDDDRSYHISSELIHRELGFKTKHSIEEAIEDLKTAFEKGVFQDSNSSNYFNVQKMKEVNLL